MSDKACKVQQSGVLPYRWRKDVLEVLLITSLQTGRWVVPKGNIAAGMTPRESAAKEAFEEAGVDGEPCKKAIGCFAYRKSEDKGGAICLVDLYPMEVTDLLAEWPEMDQRRRKWMPIKDAARSVAESQLSELMRDFCKSAKAARAAKVS